MLSYFYLAHAVTALTTQQSCSIVTSPSGTNNTCLSFPGIASLPPGPFAVHDAYPMPYFVAPPCHNVTRAQTNCSAFANGDDAGSPAYAVAGDTCYALGHIQRTPTLLPPTTSGDGGSGGVGGVIIRYSGGTGGRELRYHMICDPTASPTAGPTRVVNGAAGCGTMCYQVIWPTPHACQTVAAPCPAIRLPLPTPAQLAYQQAELVATVGFQMDTYAYDDGDPGCNAGNWNHGITTSSPAAVNPSDLNLTQWAVVLKSFGARYAWMDAKHGCGFLLWPTKTTLPDGTTPYVYDVGSPKCPLKGRDLVREFRDAMKAVGIAPGYYYSLKDNFYLNVHGGGKVGSNSSLLPGMARVTQAEFERLYLAQLRELWTNYGAMSETWFDGGWASDATPALKALISELLPSTAAFGGWGVSQNPIKWVGTESGLPSGPIWSTGTGRQGDPDGSAFVPTGCDTVLTTPHTWFAIKGMGVRSLQDMIRSYHATVGNNCVMELGFVALRSGLIPDDQVQRAAQFGDWIRTCYGNPIASTSRLTPPPGGASPPLELTVPSGASVDRVMIQEDLSKGQRIRSYVVQYRGAANTAWRNFSIGTSVGHKRIDVAPAAVTLRGPGAAFRLVIVGVAAPAVLSNFAVFAPCPDK